VPLDDVDGVVNGLNQLLFNESVRGRILAAARQTLAGYSWPRAARETLALLEKSA
jgi:glycosyltransferase involved in cell wall biosynthesis